MTKRPDNQQSFGHVVDVNDWKPLAGLEPLNAFRSFIEARPTNVKRGRKEQSDGRLGISR